MRRIQTILSILVSVVLLLACRPAPMGLAPAPTRQDLPLLNGQLVLPTDYATQANATLVRSNATVTLIDPATFQAKGTGITAQDGTFTVQALSSFTPTLGTLYLLESTKTLGTSSSALFRLRTLVQYTASGWTSISGAAIQLSTATTAVTLLWDHHGLVASDVLSKVTFEATTRTHRFTDLTATLTEQKLREVETLVSQALLVNLDPIQVVRPGPDGQYIFSMADRSLNRLVNTGFEDGTTTFPGWRQTNPAIATYSAETTIVYEASRSLKLTVNATGDTWFGQGWSGTADSFSIPLASGTAYSFSVYARGAVGGEKFAMAFNYQNPSLEIGSTTFTLTTNWQRYTWTFVSGYTTDRAIFLLRNGSGIGQATFPATLYVDNAQLEAGGAVTPYMPRGKLLLEGFANSLDSVNLTPTQGKNGRGVMVDSGLNLLPSSSFETDANSDGIPDGMSLYLSGGTYSLDSEALFGSRALKIVKATATGDYVGFSHAYPYQAGHTYTFSVWVKGSNVSGAANSDCGLYVDPVKVGGGLSTVDVFSKEAPTTGTFDWTRVSYTKTFINNCESAKIIPMFRNKTGTVWFDGYQVEENSYPAPYAGDGPDRLVFDANRYLNPLQGTLAFWYKPTYGWDDPSGNGTLVGISNLGLDIVGSLAKYRAGDGRQSLAFGIRAETPTDHEWHNATYMPATPAWKAGEWHHVALSWGPAGMTMYLDGASVVTLPYNGGIWTTSYAVHPVPHLGFLSFAGTANNFTAQINGALDGLKIWDTQQPPEAVLRESLGLLQ